MHSAEDVACTVLRLRELECWGVGLWVLVRLQHPITLALHGIS